MRGADNDVSPARPDSADPAGCPQVGVPRRAHRRGVGRRARRPVDRPPHRRRGHGRHDGWRGRVRLGVLFLVVAIVTQVLNVVVVRSATVAAWRITNGLRLDITRHVLGLDHEFHRKHTPGELIQRVDGDVTNVSNFLSQVVPKVAGAAIVLSGMLGVLTVLDWRLGLGMVVYLGVSILLVLSMRHRAVRESSDEMGSYARLYGGIEERLTAVEDLRANGAENHAMWRFVEDSAEAIASAVRREAAFLRMWWALQIDVAIGLVGTLVLSAALVSNGAITLGTAFLLFQYVHLMIRPLEELADQLEVIQKANGAMHRVVELLAIEPTVVDRGTTSPPPGPLSVTCTGVGFAYDERAADPPRRRRRDRRRSLGRRRRAHRQRQDDVLPAAAAPRRGDRRHASPSAACRSPTSRSPSCAAASPSSPRRSSCSRGRSATTSRCSIPAPTDADVEQALRHVGLDALVDTGHRPSPRRRRGRALGRAGAAARPRPRVAARPRPRRPRRGDGARRSGDRAAHRRGDRRADEGAHDVRHRPSPVDARHGRRGDRLRPRADRRARRPHRAWSTTGTATSATSSNWRWRSRSDDRRSRPSSTARRDVEDPTLHRVEADA